LTLICGNKKWERKNVNLLGTFPNFVASAGKDQMQMQKCFSKWLV
jgi:hypothetical protein